MPVSHFDDARARSLAVCFSRVESGTYAVHRQETDSLTMGDIIFDAVAMNEAAVAGDLDESRFRARRIASLAAPEGFDGIAEAACQLSRLLGPPGSEPQPGYGAAMVAISNEIDLAFGEG